MEEIFNTNEEMIEHWDMIRRLDRKRPLLKAYGCVRDKGVQFPYEYVIDGYLKDTLRDRIRSKGYPLKRSYDVYLGEAINRWEQEAKDVLGTDDILVLILPDMEGLDWSMECVAISDLMVEDPGVLEEEAWSALEWGEDRLENCKRQAYLAITGYFDYGE